MYSSLCSQEVVQHFMTLLLKIFLTKVPLSPISSPIASSVTVKSVFHFVCLSYKLYLMLP